MIATINGLPVYQALIEGEECGMMRISLVDDPAVMSLFQSFDATKRMQMYSVQNEEQRLVRGVVMRADFPIFRRDEMGEYYIMYKADQIRVMAEKYLSENRQNLVNLMHQEDSDVQGVDMVQFFIKDSAKGINPEGFEDIADGSLFAEFHILNDPLWEAIKEGTFKGFSLEGFFALAPEEKQEEVTEIADRLNGLFKRITNILNMKKIERIKAALSRILEEEFGKVTTDKGILVWDGDDDLKEGDEVKIEEEGELIAPEDGDYTTSDAKVIVVVDGKVAEIKDAEAEVAPEEPEAEPEAEETPEVEAEEMPIEEPAPEADPKDERIAELEAENDALKAENDALKAELEALKGEAEELKKMSAAKPAHEVVKESASVAKTGDRGLDRLTRYLTAK